MMKILEKKVEEGLIKFCESEISKTPYEKNGYCEKPNDICKYYRRRRNRHFCHKDTRTRMLKGLHFIY